MMGADFRVVTDTTRVAMPEICIGLYPDVAGSWLLGRMPTGIGLFMALTGCHLNSADALYLGLGNRFIDHAFREAIVTSLQEADWSGDAYTAVYHIIEHHSNNSAGWLPYSKIREHRDLIISLMGQPSIDDIMSSIQSMETTDDWLEKAKATALNGSPLSAVVSYHQLKKARYMSLKEVFCSELVLSLNMAVDGDFCEGVRALLVDKDGKPQWQFASVSDVDSVAVRQLFEPQWQADQNPLRNL